MDRRSAHGHHRQPGPVRLTNARRRRHLRHPHQTWALVVDGTVYVRAANGPASRWYQAAITQKAGRVRVAGQYYDVTFEAVALSTHQQRSCEPPTHARNRNTRPLSSMNAVRVVTHRSTRSGFFDSAV